MRKYFIGLVILVFFGLAGLLIFEITKKSQKKIETAERILKLPTFSFMKLNGEPFSTSDILEGPVLLILFNPDCENCQYEISEIFRNKISISNVKILMVSTATPDAIHKFLNQYRYSENKSIIPLVDTSYTFGDIFGTNIVPSNFVYD